MQEFYRLSDNESCGGGADKGHRDGFAREFSAAALAVVQQ